MKKKTLKNKMEYKKIILNILGIIGIILGIVTFILLITKILQ